MFNILEQRGKPCECVVEYYPVTQTTIAPANQIADQTAVNVYKTPPMNVEISGCDNRDK